MKILIISKTKNFSATSSTGKRKVESIQQPNIHTWIETDVAHIIEEMQLHLLTKLLDMILNQSKEVMSTSSKFKIKA